MKIKQITENTTSGSIATVDTALGGTRSRGNPSIYGGKKVGSLFKGKKTKSQYANSVNESAELSEAHLEEEDIIVVPGQGRSRKNGFVPHGKSRVDHEVDMARSDLFSAAKNAQQVYSMIKDVSEEEGLDGWVQEKIIKANDYLNTVREYLEGKQVQGVAEGMFTKAPAIDPTIGKQINNIINRLHNHAKRTKDEYLREAVSELYIILRNTGGTYSPPGHPGVRDVAEGSRNAYLKHNNLVDIEKPLAGLKSEFEKFLQTHDPKEKQKYQQGIKQRIKSEPMSGPKGVLPEQGVAKDQVKEAQTYGPDNPYQVKPGEDFGKVFEPGRRSGVHYHLNTGMVTDPFYFKLNNKLYSVSNKGDGIPREVGTNDQDLGQDVSMPNLIDYPGTDDPNLKLAQDYAKLMGYDPEDMDEIQPLLTVMKSNLAFKRQVQDKVRNQDNSKKPFGNLGVAEGYQLDEGAVETITALVKKIPGIGKYYQMAQQYKPQLIQILKTSKSGKEVKQKMEQLAASQSVPVAESGMMKQLGGLAVGGGSILSTMWMNAMGMIDGVLAHAAAGEVGGAVASGSILGLIPVTLMLFAAMLLFKGSQQSSDEKAQAFQAQRGQQGMREGKRNLKCVCKTHGTMQCPVHTPKDIEVIEGAKVDRMVKHVAQSEKKLGHSKKEAENIAWATANKRGMLDNKNKKA